MLIELTVENLAVVEKLRVRFQEGLNALTGETGSGKSLVVDALGLLLGGRASSDLIRTGSARAFVSGVFQLPADHGLAALLENAGIEPEDGELLIEREITANGKSRSWMASRPVAAALLKELAPFLGEIHGQHDQQRLFSPEAQRELLDAAAGADELTQAVSGLYRDWRGAIVELDELNKREQEKLRLADLWSMQKREIEAIGPKPGEDAALENERRVLKNVAKLSENLSAAYDSISDAESSAAHAVALALKRLEEAARIDDKLARLAETLRPALIVINETSHELRHYLGNLEADPERLESVEARLAGIEKLKRKYGTNIADVVAFLENVRSQLEAVETAGERREAIECRISRLQGAYREEALKLRAMRLQEARKLERQVEAELGSLAMKGTSFRIAMRDCDPAAHGMDEVEFLVSANVGEEPRPLDKVASGGELSRIALAIKTSAASKSRGGVPRTLVFDEVDAGVGGAAAEAVGRRLKSLAGSSQVLCVTHLAQIAAFADHHYAVSKRESKGRTTAAIEALSDPDRIREVGRMLSGRKLTDEALRHAERLLAESSRKV